MHRGEPHAQQLAGNEQVAQVGAGVFPAGGAIAFGIQRPLVPRVCRVAHHQAPAADEHGAPARVPRGQDAIHHVHTARHRLDHVDGMAHTHQVARLIARELGAVALHYLQPQPAPLAHPQPAQREAVERHVRELREAACALGRVGPALVDAEKRHAPPALLAQTRALIEPAARPAHGARDRLAHLLRRSRQPHQVVERHRHVRLEGVLHADGFLGREHVARAIQVGAKLHALLVHAIELGEAHHLEAAAVGEERAVPAHEPVEAAHVADGRGPGPKHEVVGVAEQDVAARGGEVVGGERFHRARRAHRQERGRQHLSVARDEPAGAGAGRRVLGIELEREGHRGVRSVARGDSGSQGPAGDRIGGRSAGCCKRSRSRLGAWGATGQGGGPKSAAATLALTEWPLTRRADREMCGREARAHPGTSRGSLFPRRPARAERATGPSAGTDPASVPTCPSPHDRDIPY